MRMKHFMVEAYCDYDRPGDKYPCKEFQKKMGLHCIECEKFSYTDAPYEISYTNEMSVVEKLEDFVAMDPYDAVDEKVFTDKWAEICRKKINEAYEEFAAYCQEKKLFKED